MGQISGGPNIIDNGLVLSFDAADRNSYPGSGTTWRDMSGNGNNGTLTLGPTFNSNNGGSIVFDGTDDYVNISPIPLTNYPITISFWGNLTNTTGLKYGMSVGEYTANHRFQIGVENGQIVLGQVSSNKFININSGINYVSGFGQFTATIQQSERRLYFNGTQIGSDISDAGTTNNWTVNILSGRPRDNSINFFWSGNIAIAMAYNRILSATEVLQNYNATKSRFGL